MTQGQAHFNRAVNMVPALAIISAFGAYKIIKFFHTRLRPLTALILLIAFAYSSLFTLNQIFVQKPLDHAWRDEQINRPMVQSVLTLHNNYQAVVVPNDFMEKLAPRILSPIQISPHCQIKFTGKG